MCDLALVSLCCVALILIKLVAFRLSINSIISNLGTYTGNCPADHKYFVTYTLRDLLSASVARNQLDLVYYIHKSPIYSDLSMHMPIPITILLADGIKYRVPRVFTG